MTQKKILRYFCIFLVSAIILNFSSCSGKKELPQDQIINYNISSEPITLDPQIADDSGARLIIMNIFEGLVKLGENEEIKEGAAENWEINGNGLKYTFHLRKNLKWNDETPLTANDFVFGISRALKPETNSPTAKKIYCIKNAELVNKGFIDPSNLGIYAADSSTLIIELEYKNPNFLSLLAEPAAMPCNEEFFVKTGGRYGRDDDMILSNGAFKVRTDGWEHDEYIYLRRNQNYIGKDTPIPAGVNINIGNMPDDPCKSVADGKTDCCEISAGDLKNAENSGLTLTSYGDTVWGIAFNTKDEVFSDKNIRNILLSGIKRENILEGFLSKTYSGGFSATSNIIPEIAKINGKSYRTLVGNCKNAEINTNTNKREEFQQALKKAGISSPPKLTILCTELYDDDSAVQEMVSNIIESWNKITGTYVNKKSVSISELKSKIANSDYSVVIAPIKAESESPIDILKLFSSESDFNISSFSSKTYDKLVENAENQNISSDIMKILSAENYLIENGIFYPLYVENRYYACAKNISGIIFHPYGAEADFFFAEKIIE